MTEFLLKRAYEAPSPSDGARLLVDRLWPRGVRKEALDAVWLRDVAPSPALRKAWHAAPADRWGEFAARYRHELDEAGTALSLVGEAAPGAGVVTLVYAAKDPEHHHAAVLRAWLQEAEARLAS